MSNSPPSNSNTTKAPEPGCARGGRGRGSNRNRRGGGRGRARGSNLRRSSTMNNKKGRGSGRQQRAKQFKGEIEELSDVVFDIGDATLRKWNAMTIKLYRYLQKTLSVAVAKLVESQRDLSGQYYRMLPLTATDPMSQ